MNFWQSLPKSFLVLAPMDDVTDTVFRQIVARIAAPDVFFTEFTNADGYCSPGKAMVGRKLKFAPIELKIPLVAQIWGSNPDNYYTMAQDLAQQGFSGIDINMGCPVREVVRHGCCSALINDHSRAAAIIEATKAGAGDLPVSVKTRIGFATITTEDWASFLLGFDLAALTLHGRTAREMSKVPAHWDEIAKAVKLRDQLAPDTLIIGNGDVSSRSEASERVRETGVDGVMIGRGIFRNPFVFEAAAAEHSVAQRLGYLLTHLDLFEETWQGQKSFEIMKKFVKIYISDFDGASELRQQIMVVNTSQAARSIVRAAMSQQQLVAS